MTDEQTKKLDAELDDLVATTAKTLGVQEATIRRALPTMMLVAQVAGHAARSLAVGLAALSKERDTNEDEATSPRH